MQTFPRIGVCFAVFAAVAAVSAGCGTVGVSPTSDGYKALAAGDYAQARDIFAAENAREPHNPFVELDLAAAYQNLGRMDLAEPLYRAVLVDGKGIPTEAATVSSDSGLTLAAIACTNLRQGLQNNSVC